MRRPLRKALEYHHCVKSGKASPYKRFIVIPLCEAKARLMQDLAESGKLVFDDAGR